MVSKQTGRSVVGKAAVAGAKNRSADQVVATRQRGAPADAADQVAQSFVVRQEWEKAA